MALPDYIIIGAQRCGTTSMMRYVGVHPRVSFVARKEIHFFSQRYGKGKHWYGQQLGKRKTGLLCGEKSADYMVDPRVPERIAQMIPRAKLICLLRNPVDRALSGFYLGIHLGREKGKFHEAIKRKPRQRFVDWWGADVNQFLLRGQYAEQLERWFRHFPREQVLVIRYEDMAENTQREYGKVLEYLGLPAFEPKFIQHAQLTKKGMHWATRRWLAEYFKPHNERLYELLGRDMRWNE
jgi:hypothetical protein